MAQSYSYGGGAFGNNVAPIALPNPSANLSAVLPGLSTANNQLSSTINSELAGDISPDTMNLLTNASASRGISSGVPGSGFSENNLLESLGQTSEQQQQQGVANYNSTIPTISSTQTLDPALQYEGTLQNAVDAAAPNPTAAAEEEQNLLQQYMKELNPAGATDGISMTPIGGNLPNGGGTVPDYNAGI